MDLDDVALGIMDARVQEWLRQKEAGQARERQLRRERGPLSPSQSWKQALELIEFAEQFGTWPPPADARRLREDERVARTWRKLKRGIAKSWPPPDQRG